MKNALFAIMLLALFTVGHPTKADALVLPDPMTYALNYGDFYSYSLPVLAYFYDRDVEAVGTGPSNPYYIASTPGHIKDSIVLLTGASGTGVNTNFDGMDNAYPTPNSSGISTFSTATTPDPDPLLTNDVMSTWDSSIASLQAYLGGDSPLFYFNNNQTNSGDSEDQTLWVFAQIKLWDSDTGADPIYFDLVSHFGDGSGAGEFGGDPANYNSPGEWDDSPTTLDYYVLSGGQTCLDAFDAPQACDGTEVAGPFNHNLGADQVAYAVFAPELDEFLMNWTMASAYDMFSMDIRMHSLNNGYEQAFIFPRSVVPSIPEPSTWLLMGLGLGALAFARKFRN